MEEFRVYCTDEFILSGNTQLEGAGLQNKTMHYWDFLLML